MSKLFLYETEDETIDDLPDDAKTPEDLFLDKEKIEKLHMALEQLPEKYRTVLQFKYFFDMGDKEIAVAFDIKPGSVREYLSRARKMAYKILEKEADLYGIK